MPTVTFFPDTSAIRAEAVPMDEADLAELIADPPEAPSKAACKLIKLGTFGDKRSKKNSLRTDENLLAVCGAEGDYDGEKVPMQQAAALLQQAGIRALLYTSPSHRPEAPRWRVLLPFSTEYPPEVRNRFLARANGVLGGILGTESFTLSQTFYIGHVNGAVYEHADVEGDYIDQRNELDARAVWPKDTAKGDPKANQPDPGKMQRLINEVMSGADYHDALNRLAAGYVVRGMPRDHVIETLQGMMLSHRTDGDATRWQARFDDIPRAVDSAVEKFAPECKAAEVADWPEPVDVFAEQPVPPFPLECLPPAYAKFAEAYAGQSGFDPGAYGFCLLINAANAIDHRSRLAVAHSFKVPPMLWGGLVDSSGGGKSPIINAASKFARDIDDRDTAQSAADLAEWESLAKKDRDEAERPRWVQRLALDTTVEKLGDLLTDNPEGVFLIADELTELIGRLDAYGNGGGKDRATYLRAFDGGATTINRIGRGNRRIENFSLGILAGIQPDKLAELYRRNGGGGDGLYQRFLFYIIAPARPADYAARIDPYIDVDLRVQIEGLWRKRFTADLSNAAARLANEYHNNMRTLAQRTPGARLAEHLSKYPGFINRVALALHAMEGASGWHGFTGNVAPETWRRAHAVMACLYRHAEAAYSLLDETAGETMRLVRSGAEAILSQGWEELTRANLTTRATGWRSADHRTAEGAIDLLIELGWLHDVTTVQPHRRGRRSDGRWTVNPGVHARFMQHAERIKAARAERFAAIKHAAEVRHDAPIC